MINKGQKTRIQKIKKHKKHKKTIKTCESKNKNKPSKFKYQNQKEEERKRETEKGMVSCGVRCPMYELAVNKCHIQKKYFKCIIRIPRLTSARHGNLAVIQGVN